MIISLALVMYLHCNDTLFKYQFKSDPIHLIRCHRIVDKDKKGAFVCPSLLSSSTHTVEFDFLAQLLLMLLLLLLRYLNDQLNTLLRS